MMAKKKEETEKETFIRRLKEYSEYAEHTKRFADLDFYQKLITFINDNCQPKDK